MNERRPIRVAIVGGGCSAMAAAFELTRPEQRGRYEVTVYQLGWRLGGKGASGRGPADRIEEHGLHVWLGWYENAFRLMRECYAELNRDPATCRMAHWSDAFQPDPFVAVTERTPNGSWLYWKAHFPPTEGLPGDRYPEGPSWTLVDYLRRGVVLIRTVLQTLQVHESAEPGSPEIPPEKPETDAGRPDLAERLSRLSRFGALATLAALLQAVDVLEAILGSFARYPRNALLRFLDAISRSAREQLEALAKHDHEVRRLWTILDLALATMRGVVRFGLLTDSRGFDAIDEYDCREWLLLNGASPQSLESGYLRGLYDLGFAYEDGDATKPRTAAGQALRGLLRAFFTYRGAFFWKMQGGMGDAVFAPFYEVLKRRGVRFEFFHRLENVKLADPASLGRGEKPYVEALEFDVQARIEGDREYEPLVDIRGLPCWPSKPRYEQLVDGERLQQEGWNFESFWDRRRVESKTLRVVDDFDFVVLAVGIGAIPHVCKDFIARDPRWRAMVDHVKTVATQAFQIWMSADMKELGWSDPPVTVSGFVEPFDTWADMRHLIGEESWHGAARSLAYFCSVLPDLGVPDDPVWLDYPLRQREQVRQNAIRFLNRDVVHLWPEATSAAGEFRWSLLVDPNDPRAPSRSDGAGADRFHSQYWTANVNPSDRYVLSLPGSAIHRISPLDNAYDNLTLAGDWTDCGFNQGCVEAAVMSGRLAAHALSQSPPLEEIVGFDHP